jgi:hypothetical protein
VKPAAGDAPPVAEHRENKAMRSPLLQLSHYVARFTLALLLVTAAATTAAAAAPTKFQSNGQSIEVHAQDASGCVFIDLWAGQGGSTPDQPQTYLQYSVWDGCAGIYVGWGYGMIPNTDLLFKGETATLTTAPSASATFLLEGTVGAFKLTATADGVYSTTFTGQWRTEYPGFVVRSKGTSTFTTAEAAGDMLGFDLFNLSAAMSSDRQRYLEIVRKQ